MKINPVYLIIIVFLFCQASCNNSNEQSIKGLWYFIANDSSYWQEIYTDSSFWCYSEEIGVMRRNYKREGDMIKIFYLDGSLDRQLKIIDSSSETITYLFMEQEEKLNKINKEYDLIKIVNGDSLASQNYIDDYRLRKYNWEKNKKIGLN